MRRLTGVVFVVLAGALGPLALSPAAASAAGPPETFIEEVRSVGASSAELTGLVNPNGASTKYHADYGRSTSEWCKEFGEQGSPEKESAPLTLSATDSTFHEVSLEITGLTAGKEYCVALVASNISGPSEILPEEEFIAGIPGLFTRSATPKGASTELIEAEVDPAGQKTKISVAYGLASSEWCTTFGGKGAPEKTTGPVTLPQEDSNFHLVSVEITGLTGGKAYCATVTATNGSGSAAERVEEFTPGIPEAVTFAVNPTGATTATVEGEVDGTSQTTEYGAAYGLESSEWCTTFGSKSSPEHTTTLAALGSVDGAFHEVSVDLTALTAGKGYCAAIVAKNASGSADGGAVGFTAGAPIVSGPAFVQSNGATTAQIEGRVNPVGQSTEIHAAYGLATSEWCTTFGEKGSPENTTEPTAAGSEDEFEFVGAGMTGLTPGKAYCAALVAVNVSGTASSEQATFTAGAPSVFAFQIPVSATTETVEGEIDPSGQTTHYHVAYGLATTEWCTTQGEKGAPEHTTATETLPFTDNAYHELSIQITGLTGGAGYCAQLIATNAAGSANARVSFTVGAPEAFTENAEATGATSENVLGEVNPVSQSTQYHVAYALAGSSWCETLTGEPESTTVPATLGFLDASLHEVAVGVSGLVTGDSYCAVLYATNGSGTTAGGEVLFTAGAPIVTAPEGRPVSTTAEEILGTVNPLGQTTKYEVGYALEETTWCLTDGFDSTPEATTSPQTLGFTDDAAHGVEVPLAGLEAGKGYCAVLTATNAAGRTDSSPVFFIVGLPVVRGGEAKPITAHTATIPAEIDPAGQVTEYHVGYGLASSKWCTTFGTSGSPEATTAIQSLPADGTYHAVEVALSGLAASSKYCAAVLASNLTGPAELGLAFFETTADSGGGNPGGGETPGGGNPGGGEHATTAATATVSGSVVQVQAGARTGTLKITCTGNATCAGKVTLTATQTVKKGGKKHTKKVVLATASFSVAAGKTATVKFKVSSAGRALLTADHGHLTATAVLAKTSPTPSATTTKHVQVSEAKKKKR